MIELLLYFLAWLSFSGLHSFLANSEVKKYFSTHVIGSYRLIYNLISIIHLGIVYGIGYVLFSDMIPYEWPKFILWSQYGLVGFGALLLILALRHYDLGLFSGLTQFRQARSGTYVDERENLSLSGMHRWVRHPLYTASFMILWGRIGSDFDLYTAIFASLYLIIGSRFEERRLIRLYGQAYRDYQARVPAFLPFKGRQSF